MYITRATQYISFIKVHEAFEELLKSIQIEPEIMDLYNAFLEDEMKTSEVNNKAELNKLKIQLDQIENRLIKSQDLMLDEKIDPDEYVSIKARHKKQKKDIKDKIDNFKASEKELIDLIQKYQK